MKIILFISSLRNRAGIERMTIDVANLLVSKHEVWIISMQNVAMEDVPFKLDSKVKLACLNERFKWFGIKAILKARRIIKEIKPDVIISVAVPVVSITAPAILGLKIANLSWEHFNLTAGSKLGYWWRLIATRLVKLTVVLTKADEKQYRAHNTHNIYTIYNFTNIGNGILSSDCKNHVMLAIGRHEPQKGFDLLLKAWAKAKILDWKLRIVGSGSKLHDHQELAKSLQIESSIEFLPNTNKIEEEYANASCFILSSRFEGLVLVLLEAKMMGLPSICFDCPNSPREVIFHEEDGWLVPPEDIDALSNQISFAISEANRLPVMGKMAKRDAQIRFSKEGALQKWEEMFSIALNK